MPISWLENEIPNNGVDDNGNGFIDENLGWVATRDVWSGPEIADGIDNFIFIDGEAGSPTIDSAMVIKAQDDPYNRYFLENGIILMI